MIDTGVTNNIMPLSMMEALGMECTKYYGTTNSIYAIDSRKVSTDGEIKYLYSWIIDAPHITIVFKIIVVELPPTYGVFLGTYWSALMGEYIMNDRSCMMSPNKYGTMLRVPWEPRKPLSFKKKDNELMQGYVDAIIGNYVVLDQEHPDVLKKMKKIILSKDFGECLLIVHVPVQGVMLELCLKIPIQLYIHIPSYWNFLT
jgi:hypothetical protein